MIYQECKDRKLETSFECVHQPSFVKDSKNFLVFENFYYMSSAIGVEPISKSNNTNSKFPLVTTPLKVSYTTNDILILRLIILFV